MPRFIKQSVFLPASFDHSGLNVHTRPNKEATAAVIFVHGLGGDGYDTWGMWPELVFKQDTVETLDVILFHYKSFYRAWRNRKLGVKLPFIAAQLADWLRELTEDSGYTDIYFVAHSLGGLIVESTVQQYLDQLAAKTAPITPVAAIFVLASPRAGAGLALGPFRQIFPEVEWLRRESPQLLQAESFFSSRVESLGTTASAGGRQFLIPRYSAMAGGDRVVSKMSGLFGIPEQQRLRLDGNHRSIVKPDEANQAQHYRLLKIIERSGEIRRTWRREHRHAAKFEINRHSSSPLLVTELSSDDVHVTWERAYNRALSRASTDDVRVFDKRNSAVHSSHETDILVCVHDAESIKNDGERCKTVINAAYEQHQHQRNLTVLIVVIGGEHEQAKGVVQSWIPDPPYRSLSLEGVPSSEDLSDLLALWIEVVIERDPFRWPQDTSGLSYGTEGSDLV